MCCAPGRVVATGIVVGRWGGGHFIPGTERDGGLGSESSSSRSEERTELRQLIWEKRPVRE